MSTLVICKSCGRELEYYEDEHPYQEVEEMCAECSVPLPTEATEDE